MSGTQRNNKEMEITHFSTQAYTEWHTKCHTTDCTHNTFLLSQKHLTSGTELFLIGWKIVPNEEHVQCDHRFASQPLANEPLHSSQLFDTSLHRFNVCMCTDTGGKRPLLLQHRTISFKSLAKSVNCLFARSPPCTKVCTKTSLSRYYALFFCIKQYNFHLLIYSHPPVVRHFTNW